MVEATLFFSIFAVIFVAELPDKTALAAMMLATRHRALPVFLGAAAALAIQSAVAVAGGSLLSLLPRRAAYVGSGLLFLVSAVVMWRRHEDEAPKGEAGGSADFGKALWMSFSVVFVAEWGDLTQIATAGFAARTGRPVIVFGAATAALWAVSALAVLVGNRARRFLDAKLTQRVAAVVFALIGLALVTGLV
jgi:putative Ca2+/H+ antiporter (TMEM165/GDT1 family)